MAKLVLSAFAREDLALTLAWSEQVFGVAARSRYDALLLQAMRDLADDPERPGVHSVGRRTELKTYRIALSKNRVPREGGKVKSPRHLLLFRDDRGAVEILRILHDAMDLESHVPPEDA
jgi:toxin ParE1/3/4